MSREARFMRVRVGLAAIAATTVAMVAARAAEPVVPVFTDVTEKAGIQFKHSFGDTELTNIVEGTGVGVMFLDYDNDGWLDIYLVNGRYNPRVNDNTGRRLKGKLSNRLYHNNHDGTFNDVTAKAGVGGGTDEWHYGVGCSAADYDGDGNIDIYLLNYGKNTLYHNNGDGTFTDVSKKSGLEGTFDPEHPRWSLSAVWFDYDGDGKLDVFVTTYLEYDPNFRNFYPAAGYPGPLSYHGQPDVLYRNNGDGTFTDVTKEAGVYNPEGRGMSASGADVLNTGKIDIFVSNDAMESDFYRNQGGGKFASDGLQFGLAFGEGGQGVSAMGPVFGDIDRDGKPDLYVPDMGYGCLHMNRGEFFEDQTNASGLALICGQYTGWGAVLQDYDNDGYLDLFIANGDAHHEYGEEAVMVHNDGKGRFLDVAKRSGPYFEKKSVGRAATWGDFDNDGDTDLLVAHLNDSPHLLRNDGGNTLHNWMTVEAKLPNGKSDAIGARVTVTTGKLIQIEDLIPMRGYLSQGDPRPHFGLGGAKKADKVEVRWADGTTTVQTDVPANQFVKIVQPAPHAE